jgi:hypothetical protein
MYIRQQVMTNPESIVTAHPNTRQASIDVNAPLDKTTRTDYHSVNHLLPNTLFVHKHRQRA